MSLVDAVDAFFRTKGFMPHGLCLLWRPSILWSMIIGNLGIAIAYFSIPAALFYLIVKRTDIGFKWIFVLFGAFILACGLTHVMSLVTLWVPLYGLEALILLVAAVISLATAVLLWPLLPTVFTLPSPWLLKKAEAKFKAIVESTPDSLVMINSQGEMVLVNSLTEILFGYTKKELIGKKVEFLIPARFKVKHEHHRLNYFTQPRVRPMGRGLELYGLHRDGHEFPVEISLSPLETDEGMVALAAVRDITERKRIEDAKAMLSAIVKYSDDAIIGKDLNGMIFSWNEAAERLYGYKEHEAIGKSIQLIMPNDEQALFQDIIQKIKNNDAIKHKEMLIKRKDGKTIPVSLTISPIKNYQGNIIGASTTARDITEQKKFHEALWAKNLELEKANLAKDQFLAAMSHEIRTPLNGIVTMTQLLLNSNLTSAQRQDMEIIHASEKQLLYVINEILDFSKIKSENIKLEKQDFNIELLAKDVILFFEKQANDKKIRLSFSMAENVPKWVKGDYTRIRQIISNLLSNAFKFTEKGEIYFNITLHEMNDHTVTLFFEVIDTGIGITPDVKINLFKPFSQGDTSMTRKYGGTGLGLIISKSLIELMGGTIDVESEEGLGSKFYFTIPFEKSVGLKSDVNAAHHLIEYPTFQHLDHIRILIAEDNQINQQVLLRILAKFGFKADVVTNGLEVLQAIKASSYHLILMDCQMPEMDGYIATMKIRAEERAEDRPHIPIIAMTAHALKGDREKCVAAGMDDYISKPIDIKTLGVLLNRYLGQVEV